MSRNRLIPTIVLTLALCSGAASPPASADVTTYKATYDVTYKGHRAASSEFSVASRDGRYEFVSSTQARGILRLARPKPAVDRSVFELVDGRVRPLEFWYEDGSRKGEDNVHIVFDWAAGEARTQSESGATTASLEPGTLDRGTMQVSIMLAMSKGEDVGPYSLIDEDGVLVYDYADEGTADAETGIGSIPTQLLRQQRDGSSRSTVLWLAPSLSYLPVRMEQWRNGAPETVFVLESVEGLE